MLLLQKLIGRVIPCRDMLLSERDKSRKMLTKVVKSTILGDEGRKDLSRLKWAPREEEQRWRIDHYQEKPCTNALESAPLYSKRRAICAMSFSRMQVSRST